MPLIPAQLQSQLMPAFSGSSPVLGVPVVPVMSSAIFSYWQMGMPAVGGGAVVAVAALPMLTSGLMGIFSNNMARVGAVVAMSMASVISGAFQTLIVTGAMFGTGSLIFSNVALLQSSLVSLFSSTTQVTAVFVQGLANAIHTFTTTALFLGSGVPPLFPPVTSNLV